MSNTGCGYFKEFDSVVVAQLTTHINYAGCDGVGHITGNYATHRR